MASVDGLRFVVPVRTINAGPNPRYFGVGRGVTYFNYTSDQFSGFHSIVIPGTLRDSLYGKASAGSIGRPSMRQTPGRAVSQAAPASSLAQGSDHRWLRGTKTSRARSAARSRSSTAKV